MAILGPRRSAAAILVALACATAASVAEARLSTAEAAYWNTHALGIVQTDQKPTGKTTSFGAGGAALDAYVAAPPGKKAPTAAVVLFTDIYGWELPNTRLWADRLAKAGYLVVIPDYFRGDSLTDATRSTIGAWRLRHPKARVLFDFDTVIKGIKKAYPSVTKIGAQGFCWGGLYTGLLSGPRSPKVDAAVGFHASSLTPADIDAVAGPFSLQQSDPKLDSSINSTFYEYIDKAFAAKRAEGIPAYITYYADMPHGYALRGNLSDPAWRTASDTAFNEGVKFFNTHLLAPAAPAAGAPAAAAKAAAAPAAGVPAAAAPAAKAATAAPARAAAGMATAPKP